MAFVEVSGNAVDIKKTNQTVTGIYIGTKTIQTKLGEQQVHEFKDAESGMIIGVYGFGHLNFKIQSLSPGMMTRVSYAGTEKIQTKYGLKDVHQSKVEIDPDFKDESKDESKDDDVMENNLDINGLPF